jgi:hypothetical protein
MGDWDGTLNRGTATPFRRLPAEVTYDRLQQEYDRCSAILTDDERAAWLATLEALYQIPRRVAP